MQEKYLTTKTFSPKKVSKLKSFFKYLFSQNILQVQKLWRKETSGHKKFSTKNGDKINF